ncbi:P-loop containing nucleoside triphosphate hydrolase protein [Rhizophagus clarus]|uniref:P-loop containing nucleoside triphosphate hydrolase protein n=1 Tax=Rhizophagus clarus TaxID=94130 RepID=A0A8H3L563_9GLOM|nr:P-loop containing nucleoside triphosphate hydrolase protein [Rhizophagus clarus]
MQKQKGTCGFAMIYLDQTLLRPMNAEVNNLIFGETLVANKAVDKCRALKDFSGLQDPRHINRIILSKFDTIDNTYSTTDFLGTLCLKAARCTDITLYNSELSPVLGFIAILRKFNT